MPISKIEKMRFLKFAVVGISGTIIDFGVFNLLLFMQFSSIFASTISFIVAVFNNFFWNRNWTYPESKFRPIANQLMKFLSVSIAGLLIRTNLYGLIEQPSIKFAERMLRENILFFAEVVGKNISLAFVIIIVLFCSWKEYFVSLCNYHCFILELSCKSLLDI
jgi:putative flippase GtrA